VAAPVVQSNHAEAGGGITSTNVSLTGVTAAATLILVLSLSPSTASVTPTITASSNVDGAFTSDVAFYSDDSTNFRNGVGFLSLQNATSGSHTVTVNSSTSLDGLSVYLMEMPSGYALDGTPATNKALSTTSVTVSGYTPSTTACVFVAGMEAGNDNPAGLSNPPSGWTSEYAQQNGATVAQFAPLVVALKNATTGAQSATVTWTSSRTGYAAIAGYVQAAGGPSNVIAWVTA